MIIFLSDGECSIADEIVQDICRSAVRLGYEYFRLSTLGSLHSPLFHRKPLSLQTVSFGPRNEVLRRMARIALDIQNSAPAPIGAIASAPILSSYSEALDTVRLHVTPFFFARRSHRQINLSGPAGPNVPWLSGVSAQDEGFPDALNFLMLMAVCAIVCSIFSFPLSCPPYPHLFHVHIRSCDVRVC